MLRQHAGRGIDPRRTGLQPFFSYYGGKYRIALRYPAPRHAKVVEPFAGSAGYAVRHYRRDVLLCDLNPKVTGTWDYLIKASFQDIMRLPARVDDVRKLPDSVCQEARWLIGWWLQHGASRPGNKATPGWVSRPDCHWGPMVQQRLARQADKIRHWKTLLGDYRELPGEEATWFVDPPYQNPEHGSHYPFHDVDYRALGEWCKGLRGQVIACESEGADWLPFRPFCLAKATPKSDGSTRVTAEMIWTSNDGGC